MFPEINVLKVLLPRLFTAQIIATIQVYLCLSNAWTLLCLRGSGHADVCPGPSRRLRDSTLPQVTGGIPLAVAYEKEENLLVPITIHILGNMAIFVLALMF